MKVVGTVGIQIAQFQIGVAERGSAFCRAGIDAGVAAVTALTGFLVPIPHIDHAVFLRPVYGHSRNRATEFELHFRFMSLVRRSVTEDTFGFAYGMTVIVWETLAV